MSIMTHLCVIHSVLPLKHGARWLRDNCPVTHIQHILSPGPSLTVPPSVPCRSLIMCRKVENHALITAVLARITPLSEANSIPHGTYCQVHGYTSKMNRMLPPTPNGEKNVDFLWRKSLVFIFFFAKIYVLLEYGVLKAKSFSET